tara:strand:+ start:8811 stop:8912 length:102 start_codon:yes stop_codon:yes gene_type:complete
LEDTAEAEEPEDTEEIEDLSMHAADNDEQNAVI